MPLRTFRLAAMYSRPCLTGRVCSSSPRRTREDCSGPSCSARQGAMSEKYVANTTVEFSGASSG